MSYRSISKTPWRRTKGVEARDKKNGRYQCNPNIYAALHHRLQGKNTGQISPGSVPGPGGWEARTTRLGGTGLRVVQGEEGSQHRRIVANGMLSFCRPSPEYSHEKEPSPRVEPHCLSLLADILTDSVPNQHFGLVEERITSAHNPLAFTELQYLLRTS